MANNTSLYTYVTTPTVASNNFTTLYNGVTSVGVNTNYGNANVEAFLNAGTDGSNIVQNILMSGNLNVGGTTNLGNVGNIHITGGGLNYVLETDGNGGLNWVPLPSFTSNTTTYIHFDVIGTGNNQTFTNSNLIVYANSNTMAVFKNGINIEPSLYTINGSILTINILLNVGDTIDVLPSTNGGSNGTTPGGSLTEVQYNGGANTLSGNATFTFDQANSLLNVGNVKLSNTGTLKFGDGNVEVLRTGTTLELISGDTPNTSPTVGNISIISLQSDTSNSQVQISSETIYISTTGVFPYKQWQFLNTGNLKFPDGTYQNTAYTGGSGGLPAGSNTQVQYNNAGNFGASSSFTFNSATNTLTVANIVGNVATANYASYAGNATVAISATTAGNSLFANTANIANIANYANYAGNAFSIDGANVIGFVANANYANYTGNVLFSNSSNYANYANFSGTSYSVAGANVTGYVANASHATIADSANSVLAANISGIVANANYAAYAGNFSGTIANANYSNYTGTVINATQSNITSVGTLTTLNVSGTSNVANTNFNKFNETIYFAGTVSGTLTPDASVATIYEYTLNGNITLNSIGNAVAGTSMTIRLTQDGTGGRTLSSTMKFAGGLKTLSTTGGTTDIISLYYNGTNYYAVLSKGYV